ncbi:hypothetical protein Mapa_010856 [Marchantia paleacea]|nr:hypothetical protein Mapa_010856 [Marchantia paleacea]
MKLPAPTPRWDRRSVSLRLRSKDNVPRCRCSCRRWRSSYACSCSRARQSCPRGRDRCTPARRTSKRKRLAAVSTPGTSLKTPLPLSHTASLTRLAWCSFAFSLSFFLSSFLPSFLAFFSFPFLSLPFASLRAAATSES